MDKTTYGTYEYLPTNNNSGTDLFFVVEQDGTYLINRPVEYVTEVQDVTETHENVQPCTVYDVTPQQFYVNVDDSSELISAPDQFIIPDESSNLYNSSYLLQPESNTTNNQIEQDVVVDQYKEDNTQMDVDVDTNTNTNTNNYTEITLNDEQYSQLEAKGWILLDINDKVFVLDTLGGLRDITNKEKLVEKLKIENQDYAIEKAPSSVKIENDTSTFENVTQNLPVQKNTVELVIGNDENIQNVSFIINDKEECNTSQQIVEPVEEENIIITENDSRGISENYDKVVENEQENTEDVNILLIDDETSDRKVQENNVLRIKTKLSFKDFPDKIVLGKTINGKKLVAKVKKKDISAGEVSKLKNNNTSSMETLDTHSQDKFENLSQSSTEYSGLNEMEFRNVLEQALQGNYESKLTAKEFEATEVLITQLIQVPSFKNSILSDNLCITKVIQREDSQGNITGKSEPTVITGQIRLINNQWRFVHNPNMLTKLVYKAQSGSSNTDSECTTDNQILHIHVLETKQKRTNSDFVKTAVSVLKRNLPQNLDAKNLKTTKVYACAACAALFKTEQDLKEHHKIHCANTSKESKTSGVVMKKENNVYYLETGKEKVYCCMECNAQFKKLSFCKNHIKTHPPKNQESETEQEKVAETQSNTGIYKCKMCPCSYFHSSTLSKHILTRHIRVK